MTMFVAARVADKHALTLLQGQKTGKTFYQTLPHENPVHLYDLVRRPILGSSVLTSFAITFRQKILHN